MSAATQQWATAVSKYGSHIFNKKLSALTAEFGSDAFPSIWSDIAAQVSRFDPPALWIITEGFIGADECPTDVSDLISRLQEIVDDLPSPSSNSYDILFLFFRFLSPLSLPPCTTNDECPICSSDTSSFVLYSPSMISVALQQTDDDS